WNGPQGRGPRTTGRAGRARPLAGRVTAGGSLPQGRCEGSSTPAA
ncbi:MAG: hypothetical protein AVDCRST_MAG29-1156, partial [uncultured Nocardioidaceae bacterium]